VPESAVDTGLLCRDVLLGQPRGFSGWWPRPPP